LLAISFIKTLGLNIMLILNFIGSVSECMIGAARPSSLCSESALEEPELGLSRFGVDGASKQFFRSSVVNNSGILSQMTLALVAKGTASRGTFGRVAGAQKSILVTEFRCGSACW